MSAQPSDMQYDGNDIPHDTLDDMIGAAEFTADAQPLPEAEAADPFQEFLTSDLPQMEEPDAALLEPPRRTPTAKRYERKVAGLFSLSIKVTAQQENLMADSAAMLLYGPDISMKMGDLAAQNARVARAIDMVTDHTENAATAVIMAAAPFVLQVIRNHEPILEAKRSKPARTLHIPFTKRSIRLRLGFKLGKRMKAMTQDPKALQRHVFTNEGIVAALAAQGIHVNVS